MIHSQDYYDRFYQRILSIDWSVDISKLEIHRMLIEEYLRRSAMWAIMLKCINQVDPFFDIALRIDPNFREDPAKIKALLDHLSHIAPKQARRVCEWALHWEAISTSPKANQFSLPAPYEPLLVLFEQRGTFSLEHGWIDIDIDQGGMKIANWESYAKHPPFVELNDCLECD